MDAGVGGPFPVLTNPLILPGLAAERDHDPQHGYRFLDHGERLGLHAFDLANAVVDPVDVAAY